jgi:hypothetical protein
LFTFLAEKFIQVIPAGLPVDGVYFMGKFFQEWINHIQADQLSLELAGQFQGHGFGPVGKLFPICA